MEDTTKQAKHPKVTVQCGWCGKDVVRHASTMKRLVQTFCSPECRKQAMGQRSRKRKTVTCEVCGKAFELPASHADRGRRFCSNECRFIGQHITPTRGVPSLEKVCPQCGQTFNVIVSRQDQRFCSRECARASHTVERTCPTCGKTFRTTPGIMHTYCSRACATPNATYRECPRCGKTFRVSKADRQYCSEACRRPPVINTCLSCGKEFRIVPAMAYQKFCSPRCYRCYTGETEPEHNVRLCLENMGVVFEREHVFAGWRYPVDFYLPGSDTVIEIDGAYWHSTEKARRQDGRKTDWLTARGHRVVRLPDTNLYGPVTTDMMTLVRNAVGIADQDIADGQSISPHPIQLAIALGKE